MGTDSASIVTVSCPCGSPLEIDTRNARPVRVCPQCKDSLTIVVTVDPSSGKRRVGILVSPAAVAPKRGKPRTVKLPPLKVAGAPRCACGADVPVNSKSVDSVYTCGWCGACYTTLAGGDGPPILIPVHIEPLKKEKPKTAIRRPKTVSIPQSKVKESLLVMTQGTLGAQPLREQEKGSLMSCFCGHEIAVSPEAAHRILKCQECGLSFRVFMAVDPRSKKPMVITLPRAPAEAKGKA